ncbi:MAG: hypothetical protein ABL907_11615 [Hyphomicrobium sp.]
MSTHLRIVLWMNYVGAIITFTRGWKHLTVGLQQAANERAILEISRVAEVSGWDAKQDKIGWRRILSMATDPPPKERRDYLVLYLVALLPDDPRRGGDTREDQLFEALEEARALKLVIVESATGRRSDNPKDYRLMRAHAKKSLRDGRRGLPDGMSPMGRPKLETIFPVTVIEAAEKMWKNKSIVTDDAAAELAGVQKEWMRRRWGRSGRPPGRRPIQKRKR